MQKVGKLRLGGQQLVSTALIVGAFVLTTGCVSLSSTVNRADTAPAPMPESEREDQVAAAREIFERNLSAIEERDREKYLSCYLQSPSLVRNGPSGPNYGYAGLEEAAGSAWPDLFEGKDLELTWVAPGVVYGSYRYHVKSGDNERFGISERVFVRTDEGWKIAVTTAFDGDPPEAGPDSP